MLFIVFLSLAFIILILHKITPRFMQQVSNKINGAVYELIVLKESAVKTYFVYQHSKAYITKLQQDNQYLTSVNQSLNNIRFKADLLSKQNAELLHLLGLEKNPSFYFKRLITAPVYFKNLLSAGSSLMVNKGSSSGITTLLPVVHNNILIGTTYNVEENTSDIILINNSKSKVPVFGSKSKTNAVMLGQDGRDPILMTYAKSGHFIEGELVLTSGMGKLYPRNIAVGFAHENKNSRWTVKLLDDLGSIDYVSIIITK